MNSTAAWAMPCTFRNLFNADRTWMYMVNGMISGSMVLLEAPGRRLELALYVAPRALESLWKILEKYLYVRNVKNGEVLLFSFGTAVCMTLYNHDPESIDDNYRNIITRFVGVN
jgi:hypothetical protein